VSDRRSAAFEAVTVIAKEPAEEASMGTRTVHVPNTAFATLWSGHLRTVDRALARSDVNAARRAWDAAHVTTVESQSSQRLIEIGRACLRIGAVGDCEVVEEYLGLAELHVDGKEGRRCLWHRDCSSRT
jgi:hypothetical protein